MSDQEMTPDEFEKTWRTPLPEPPIDKIIRRFQHGFLGTHGNEDAALAAVNEVLEEALDYEGFMAKLRTAA